MQFHRYAVQLNSQVLLFVHHYGEMQSRMFLGKPVSIPISLLHHTDHLIVVPFSDI